MEKILLIIICISAMLFFIVSLIKVNQQNKYFKQQLILQNKEIIFTSNPNLNFKIECFKPEDFFLMQNTGSDPCEEVKTMKYVRNFSKKDLYIKKRTEYEL